MTKLRTLERVLSIFQLEATRVGPGVALELEYKKMREEMPNARFVLLRMEELIKEDE